MKKFLMTTAVALAMTTTAYAQTASVEYMQTAQAESLLASDLLGARVYATETDAEINYSVGLETEWDDIGEINDVIVSRDGKIEGVVLGVGGFLGMGEKDVAVSMDDLRFISDGVESDEWFVVVTTTAEALEAAPAFEYRDEIESMATEISNDTAATMDNIETNTEVMADDVTAEAGAMATTTAEALESTGDAIEMEAEEMATATSEAMNDVEAEVEAEMSDIMDGFVMVDIASVAQEDLVGATVYGTEYENVGEIGELIEAGAVIEVGGFLGLGEKQVLIPMEDLHVYAGADGEIRVHVVATEESLEALPEYEVN